MIFGLHFRERLQKGGALGSTIIVEFQRLMASLRTWGEVEHNDDGTHGAVTATSVAVSGDVTAEGDITAGGDVVVGGIVDLSTDDNDIALEGVDHTGSRSRWNTYPTTTVVADNVYPAVQVSRMFIPAVDDSVDIGFTGSSNRRFKNGVFSGTLEGNQVYGVVGLYERARNTAVGEWEAYTPVWGVTTGAAPARVNGTLTGRSMRIGKTRFVKIKLTAGFGTTFGGGGAFTFTVPSSITGSDNIGTAQMFDSSAGLVYSGHAQAFTATTITVYAESTHSPIAAAVPFTFATDDTITINFQYEEA